MQCCVYIHNCLEGKCYLCHQEGSKHFYTAVNVATFPSSSLTKKLEEGEATIALTMPCYVTKCSRLNFSRQYNEHWFIVVAHRGTTGKRLSYTKHH